MLELLYTTITAFFILLLPFALLHSFQLLRILIYIMQVVVMMTATFMSKGNKIFRSTTPSKSYDSLFESIYSDYTHRTDYYNKLCDLEVYEKAHDKYINVLLNIGNGSIASYYLSYGLLFISWPNTNIEK